MDDLTTLARHQLDDARASAHGRSAHLFLHDGPLRQTVIALTAGSALDDHTTPPAASLQVLHGHVRLTPADGSERRSGSGDAGQSAGHGMEQGTEHGMEQGTDRSADQSAGRDLIAGQIMALPHERHGLKAVEDSAVLLTAVTATAVTASSATADVR
ncbi:cupin [Streptomyces sp. MST-110588]|uniref:cupin n=1 Tax=Streptomyces sp. MST-110588 TaxID=2833628 RepID=UPI001F5CEA11|nr:cupin [Streptomyces sp. MST-110588]